MTHAPISHETVGPRPTGERLDNIAWAIFFILTGALWLLPEPKVPPGTWFLGIGLLLLGLNAARRMSNVAVSGFVTLLGVLALAAGVSATLGVEVPIVAIGLILLGLGVLGRELSARRG